MNAGALMLYALHITELTPLDNKCELSNNIAYTLCRMWSMINVR